MERSRLVQFEGIQCSLPLVGCDGAGDALFLRQPPFSVHLVCYTSICAVTGVKRVCPDLPRLLCDVPCNLRRIEDRRDPVFFQSGGGTALSGPEGVGQNSKLVRVNWCLGHEVQMVVVVVAAHVGKAPSLHPTASFCGFAVDHAI